MLTTSSSRLLLAFVCVSSLGLAGCGGAKPVSVTGDLILLPNVKLGEGDTAEVRFIPVDSSGKLDKAGKGAGGTVASGSKSFTAEMMPGKYRISIQLTPYQGSKGSEDRARTYEVTNQAFTPDTSKLTYEVTSDANQSITIDLAKGSVTKK